MPNPSSVMHLAEIPYETGEIRARYERYLATDKTHWVRHGRFTGFYKNGRVSSEGTYEHGSESGLWRDYHENGQLAAEGEYLNGQEVGIWKYWAQDGTLESSETHPRGSTGATNDEREP